MVGVPRRLEAVRHAIQRGLSQRRACQLLGVARSRVSYRRRQSAKDRSRREAIQGIATQHPTWGYRLVAGWLRENGVIAGVKRVRR